MVEPHIVALIKIQIERVNDLLRSKWLTLLDVALRIFSLPITYSSP